MALRTTLIIAALPLLGVGCQVVSVKPNLEHCTYNEGDDYCADLDPSRPYCTQGDAPCNLGGYTGCVAEVTTECHAPCGTLPEDECVGESSSGSDTGTGSGSESGSESTTGPMPCGGDEDCMDAEAPFCEPVSGECVGCEATADPDGACLELDANTPLCVGGACVACTPETPIVCEDQGLLCDGETNTCVPCTAHEQCTSGACELSVGRCFPEDFVVTVDGDGGADYPSVVLAVADVADGAHGVIVVHELDGGSSYQAPGGLIVGGGKTIALLAAPGEAPIIQGTGGNPGLRVETAGTILYMDGLSVSGNTGGLGLEVDGAYAWLDRSRIVQNSGGGIVAQNAGELTLRNCFVGDGTNGAHGLAVDGATTVALYSSFGAGVDNFEDVFPVFCNGAVDVTIRNGVLVSFDNALEISCSTATVTNTASEALIPGAGNVALGDVGPNWFLDVNAGNFHLTPMAPMAIATTAVWQPGDPPTDIDGDPRPTTDGAMDYAGADAVPP